MDKNINQGKIDSQTLESIFRTSKKTIQEYVSEIERNCRYKSTRSQVVKGVILDDRSRLIDLYEACVQQDAHIRSVLETLESQIIGERYMLARQNANGQYVRDVEATKKIQGSQFIKIIKGIAESKLYGYTLIEINPTIDPITGKLNDVNLIEIRKRLSVASEKNQQQITKLQIERDKLSVIDRDIQTQIEKYEGMIV